jgi:hypothetical protein
MSIDDRYPNPDLVLRPIGRRAAASAAAPDPQAAEGAGAGDVPVYALRDGLKAAQARVKRLEAALRIVSKTVAPYARGNGR